MLTRFARQWVTIKVPQAIDFTTSTRQLPFPTDAHEVEFSATFSDIELVYTSWLVVVSQFYRTEMSRRGWNELEKAGDEDSIEVTFQHGQALVELRMRQRPDGVEVSLDCPRLSFEGTKDPAGLLAFGLFQPQFRLFLQKEIELPSYIRELEFVDGDRCLFKCDLGLEEAFDQLRNSFEPGGIGKPVLRSSAKTDAILNSQEGRLK